MNAWLVIAVIFQTLSVFFAWRGGHRRGFAMGLRQPLGRRQAALTAEVRRAENAMALALPRTRVAAFNRRTRRHVSNREG